MNAVTQAELDQQVYDLYDEYCHGRIDRREFLRRAGALGAGALAMAYGLMPDYARAQTISFTDSRIKAQYVSYASPGGNGEKMRGYLVQPAGQGLGDLAPLVRLVARRDRVRDTVRDVLAQDFLLDPAQRGANSRDLRHDIDAVAIFIDHARQATHLPFDTIEAFGHRGLDIFSHAGYIPP